MFNFVSFFGVCCSDKLSNFHCKCIRAMSDWYMREIMPPPAPASNCGSYGRAEPSLTRAGASITGTCDTKQDYVADGITDSLINDLARAYGVPPMAI